jgi:hypothetical protein
MYAPPFPIGTASTATALAADLGKVYFWNGNGYRLVKASTTIALAASQVLVTALSSGVPTWAVTTTDTANLWTVAGVVPVGQTGTGATTTSLISGDYFLIQISGPTKCVSAAAIANGGLVGTSTTAGKVDDASVTAGVGAMGVALEAAADVDITIDVLLKGLL